MRSALLILILAGTLSAVTAESPVAAGGQLVDRSVRYVNGQVITLGDLVDHIQSNRPRKPPSSTQEELQIWRDALERVTDDTLLRLFAEEKEVYIDPGMLGKRILEDLKRRDQLATPDAITRWRRELIKREMVRAALGFFDARCGNITPRELSAAYAERKAEFTRPARVHLLQLVLRAGDADERAGLVEAQAEAFRSAQALAGPVADLAASRLDALLAVADDEAARAEELAATMRLFADLPDDGLAEEGKAFRAKAQGLVERADALRSQAQVQEEIDALRADLAAADEAAFRAAVAAHSEGPRKDDGGDLGWIERGRFHESFDAVAFDQTQVGTVSETFWIGDVACLVRVLAREEARQRPFAEVCGELETQLREERYDEVYQRAASVLRKRATIRDQVELAELLRR